MVLRGWFVKKIQVKITFLPDQCYRKVDVTILVKNPNGGGSF